MKLTELLICLAIFFMVSVAFLETFTNVRNKLTFIEHNSSEVNMVLENDLLIRKEINNIELCYWKNFDNELKEDCKRLNEIELKGGSKINKISQIYDKSSNRYGVKVEWTFNKKKYVTQELIKNGIVYVEN